MTDIKIVVVPDNEDENSRRELNLWDFTDVSVSGDFVFFKDEDDKVVDRIGLEYFVKGSFSNPNQLAYMLTGCARIAKRIYDSIETADDALADLKNAAEEDKPSEEYVDECTQRVLDLATEPREKMLAYYYKTVAYDSILSNYSKIRSECEYGSDEYNEYDEKLTVSERICEDSIDKALSAAEEDDELFELWFPTLAYWKACSLQNRQEYVAAVRMAILALDKNPDDDEEKKLKSIISCLHSGFGRVCTGGGYGFSAQTKEGYLKKEHEENLKGLEGLEGEELKEMQEFVAEIEASNLEFIKTDQDFFSNRPYIDRQFIFVVRDLNNIVGCYDHTDTIKYVIPINEMPGDITFPFGHPQPNTLYYAHPLRPHYLLVEKASLALFHEKVQEICRLFQCLGATEITTRTLKGHKVSESYEDNSTISVEAGRKLLGASGSLNRSGSGNSNTERRDEMSLTQTFVPTKAPYCPDDLVWAANDPEIQTFIKQRLNGGLQRFSKRVSSSETMSVSSSQMMDVKAAFNTFMTKVSGNYNAKTDRTFSETTETEWEISVVFKPINKHGQYEVGAATHIEAAPTEALKLSNNEQQYLEELQFAYEDGEIGPSERKFLERKRIKLGISEERAKEIEESICGTSLTDDEKEYIELYKEYAPDGNVSDRVRRILKRGTVLYKFDQNQLLTELLKIVTIYCNTIIYAIHWNICT